LKVLAILAYPTTWGTSAPADSAGSLTHYPSRDYGEWANYVAAIVTRYKSDVHYWEVWNEPDLAEFWNGTPAQYAALLDVTSSTIKQIARRRPSCSVDKPFRICLGIRQASS
jgi:hypothetical protein